MNALRTLLVLSLAIGLSAVPAAAQVDVTPMRAASIGANPTDPDGSSLRLQDLLTAGGTSVLLVDAEGDVIRRVLGVADIPSVFGRTDTTNTWSQAQTFSGGALFPNGSAGTPSGRFSGDTNTGFYRVSADSFGIAVGGALGLTVNTTGTSAAGTLTSSGAFTASSTSTLTGATTVGSTLGVTGLSTLTGGFNAGANSSVTGTFGVSGATTLSSTLGVTGATTLSSTLDVSGLTTAALIRTTGLYGVADPFEIRATNGTTPRVQVHDAGRNVVTTSGNDTAWEYHGTGNPSGQRVWRTGNIGGNFLIQSGNDAASTWTNLARSTMASGVPNGWFWGTGVRSVTPDLDFTTDLGEYPTQYANMWVRNLWATSLVEQDVISTIGGAVLVTPTTTLEAAVSAGDTTFQVAHNEMAVNDIAYINDALATEFVQVTSAPLAGASSISFIGENEAVGTSVTLPTHQAGDLLLVFAFRNAATAPSLPAGGWVSLCTGSGGSTSFRVGYLIATGAGTASGTWTNATSVMAHVYRSSVGNMPAPGACTTGNGSASTSLVYPAITLTKTDHSSWVARAAMSSAGTNIQTAPSGYTLRSNNTAVPESASFDSNGRITATSVAASSGLTITSANWRAVSVEIVGIGLAPFSYTVTRGYGGTFAARAWPGGVALANTGTTGDGGINMYAIQSIKGSGEQGPTIQGYERTSSTFNALGTRWALGNLRGLYTYGATDVYGAAFGNADDVWVGIDATNGVRFFDGGTTVNSHFALDGSITLGQTGAGQANTRITPSAVALRRGTDTYISMSAGGLEMFDASAVRRVLLNSSDGLMLGTNAAGVGNVQIDTGGTVRVRSGTQDRITLAASNGEINVLDPGGVQRVTVGNDYSVFGRVDTGQPNWLITPSAGTAALRVGTSNAVLMESSGRVTLYKPGGTIGVRLDASDGITIGDIATAGQPYVQIVPGGMSFCRTTTFTCTLSFDGSNGNITSTGSILLSAGGNVTSTGEWSLTSTTGLTFEASPTAAGSAARALNWVGGGRIYTYSGDLYLTAANVEIQATNAAYKILTSGGHAIFEAFTSSVGGNVTLRPRLSAGTSFLGDSSFPWMQVHGTTFYGGGSAGLTQTVTVRDAAGTGTCTLIFSGGIKTGGTC